VRQLIQISVYAAGAFFTWAILIPAVLRADEPDAEIITQVASGVGAGERQAEVEAVRAAVQQAAGSIISAETLIKNDQLINDKVLIYSDGIVKSHEIVGQPTKTDGGLVRVTVRAQVQRRELIRRLEAASVHTVDVNGQNMIAQWEAELQNEKDGAQILKRIFDDLPIRMLKAEIIGAPRQISVSDDSAKVGIQVRFSVDRDNWTQWIAVSKPYLEKLCTSAKSLPIGPDVNQGIKVNRFSYINFSNIKKFTGKDWAGEDTDNNDPYDFNQLSVAPERRQTMFGDDRWGTVSMTRGDIESSVWSSRKCWFAAAHDDERVLTVIDRIPSGNAIFYHFNDAVFAGLTQARLGIPSFTVTLIDASGREIASKHERTLITAPSQRGNQINTFAATMLWCITYNAYDRERRQQRMSPLDGDSAQDTAWVTGQEGFVRPKIVASPSLAGRDENCFLAAFSNEFFFDLSKAEWSRFKQVKVEVLKPED